MPSINSKFGLTSARARTQISLGRVQFDALATGRRLQVESSARQRPPSLVLTKCSRNRRDSSVPGEIGGSENRALEFAVAPDDI